jgi:hypothetical protein
MAWKLEQQQGGPKYSVEAGVVIGRLGMRQNGQKYSMEARTVVGRSGTQ